MSRAERRGDGLIRAAIRAVLLFAASGCVVSFEDYPVETSDAGTGGSGDSGATPSCFASFDASAQSVVQIPDAPELRLTAASFTIEARFRLLPGQSRIDVHKRGPGGWSLGLTATHVRASVFEGFDHDFAAAFPYDDGVWRHVAWEYDGQLSRLYVDGKAVGEAPHSEAVSDSTTAILLGALRDASGNIAGYTSGATDEVRITSGVRYGADFAPPAAAEVDAATIGLWHLDGDAMDAAGSSHGESSGVVWGDCPP